MVVGFGIGMLPYTDNSVELLNMIAYEEYCMMSCETLFIMLTSSG